MRAITSDLHATTRWRTLALVVALTGAMLAAGVVTAGPSLGQAGADREEVAAAVVRPSIVYLDVYWTAWVQDHDGDWLNGGNPFQFAFSCTGFVVNPSGYIGTAAHCVDPGLEGAAGFAIELGVDYWIEQGWASDAQRDQLTQIAMGNWTVEGEGTGSPPDREVLVQRGPATVGADGGQAWAARVVEMMPMSEGDVALLKVERTNLPTVLLVPDADIAVGMPVLSVGYPASFAWVVDETYEPTFKDGRISSITTRSRGLVPVYEISAAVTHGMSGGPTVNMDGAVIGVNSFRIIGESQPFNFVSPASLLSELLARNGVANALGPVDDLYRSALDHYFAEEWAEARDGFAAVLDRDPTHEQARDYRTVAADRAAAQPAPEPEPEPQPEPEAGFPMLGVGLAILVLVAFGVAGAVLLLRRRRSPGGDVSLDATPTPTTPLPPPPPPPPAADLPDMAPLSPAMIPHDVFVSYSNPDKPVADAIVARLEREGIRCWIAPRDVIPGQVWGSAIVKAIQDSRLMIVVISDESNQSTHVPREVERAVANDVIVVPFRIDAVEPTGAMAYYLASEHWLDAMTPPLESHLTQLAQVAHALLDSASTATS
jgi:serine protease Do